MFVRASLYKRRKENQLVATKWFIALITCSTCFGPLYAHHQELVTIVCYYRIWCVMPWLLVVGGQEQGNRLCVRDEGICSTSSLLPSSSEDVQTSARNMSSRL